MRTESTLAPRALSHAPINGAIVHERRRVKSQGLLRRAAFKAGTVFYAACLIPFLVVAGLLLAFDAEKQEWINRKHGEGEV